jgi:ubiquinone/menaquinone biosynthesis C-methylase UbiE
MLAAAQEVSRLSWPPKIAPGQVVGIDVEDSQFTAPSNEAASDGLNVEFQTASVCDLLFQNQSFDVVFSHGLLEHLSNPAAAIAEFRRVLKPGGLIGLRTSDLGGLLVDSESGELGRVFAACVAEQNKDAKDLTPGRKLGRLMQEEGFQFVKRTASYEVVTANLGDFSSFLPDLEARRHAAWRTVSHPSWRSPGVR